jgi:MFS family permease
MLFVALGVQAAGALLCAASTGLGMLVAARVVQGLGGGGLLTIAVALIGEQLSPRERGRFQAWIAAVFTSSSALGPLLGGALTQGLGWRAVFLLGPPVAALAAALAVRRLPAVTPSGRAFRFDALGAALFAAFVVTALLALDQAQRVSAAALPGMLGLAALAAVALWALLAWERRAPDPLLPIRLLSDPVIWRTNLMGAFVMGAQIGLVSFLPVYLQVVRGLAPTAVGMVLLPMTAMGGLGAFVAGMLMARTGRAMVWPSIGLVLACAALAAVAGTAGWLPLAAFPAVLALGSMGFGTSFPIGQTVVQAAAGQERLGMASASVQFSRNLGAATGTALMGAVLFAALSLGEGEAAGLFRRMVTEGGAALAALEPARAEVVRAEVAGAFRAAFATAAAMAGAAALMAWLVPLRRVT